MYLLFDLPCFVCYAGVKLHSSGGGAQRSVTRPSILFLIHSMLVYLSQQLAYLSFKFYQSLVFGSLLRFYIAFEAR